MLRFTAPGFVRSDAAARLLLFVAISMVLAARTATAQTSTWNNSSGGSYDTAGNWSPSGVPGSAANIDFNLNNTYTVSMSIGHAVNNANFNAGTVTFTSSGSITTGLIPSNNLNVGTGLLTLNDIRFILGNQTNINNGGRVRVLNGLLESDTLRMALTGGDGSLLVSGSNSSLVLIGTAQSLIGQNGNSGTLTLANSATALFGGSLSLAASGVAGSTGVLSVGTNCTVTAETLNAGTGGFAGQAGTISLVGDFIAGPATITQTGTAALNLGASANSVGVLSIGENSTFTTGTGAVTVNKTGSIFVSSGGLIVNGNMTINGGLLRMDDFSISSPHVSFANGSTVTVQNGGTIERASGATTGSVSAPAAGTLLVTGAGSRIRNLAVGIGSGGTLIVSAGGNIDNATNIGGISASIGTLIIDGGSVTNSGISVGGGTGNAALIVRNNGIVNSPDDTLGVTLSQSNMSRTASIETGGSVTMGELWLGVHNGANSTALLSVGPGSTLSLTGGSSARSRVLMGGSANVGTLGILSGGTLATGAGSVNIRTNGWLNLSGRWNSSATDLIDLSGGTITQFSGSVWTLPNGGEITVDNGGVIQAVQSVIPPGGTLTVSGSGARVDCGSATAIASGGAVASIVSGGSFSAGGLTLGQTTNGTMIVDGAGSVANFLSNAIIGNLGGDGSLIVSGAAHASINGALTVGGTGSLTLGRVSVLGGSSLSVGGNIAIGTDPANFTSSGILSISDPGSIFSATGSASLSIGSAGAATGTLLIDNFARFNSASGNINLFGVGHIDVRSGQFTMNGNLTDLGGQIDVGGSMPFIQPPGRFEMTPGHSLSILAGFINLHDNGVLGINGGTLTMHSAALNFDGGSVDFNAGTIVVTDAFSPDALLLATLLGSQATLFPGHAITSVQTLTLGNGMILDGGTLSAGKLVGGDNLLLRSGHFALTSSPLTIGPSGAFTQLSIPAGVSFAAQGAAGTITSGGLLQLDGGSFDSASTLSILSGGELRLSASSARISSGTLLNSGLVSGTGRIDAAVINNPGGIIRADASDHLTLTASNMSNSGMIQLLGGAIELTQPITNNAGGAISGHGSLFTGGLTNNGSLTLVGPDASIFGATTNSATARVLITSGTNATFFDPVTNQAGSIFKVSDASVAAFLSPVTGLAAFTGNGTTIFESTASAGPLAAGTSVVESAGGSLTASSIRQAALIVRGQAQIAPDGTTAATSKLGSLEIEGTTGAWTGKFDLSNNDLIIDYDGASVLPTVRDQIKSGFNHGAWNGNGITSSLADAIHRLGYLDNAARGLATFGGQSVDPTSILIKYTFAGDSNLDGQVDVTDLGALATNWQTTSDWTGGDFNYDGFVDVTDLGILATNWQAGVGSPLGPGSLEAALASVGLGNLAVPEPAAACLMTVVLTSALRRRRRALVS